MDDSGSLVHFMVDLFSSKAQQHWKRLSRKAPESRCMWAPQGLWVSFSQGDPGTVLLEFAGKYATIQLVKLHQLNQVSESRVTVIQTVGQLAFILHLQKQQQWTWDCKIDVETLHRSCTSKRWNTLLEGRGQVQLDLLYFKLHLYFCERKKGFFSSDWL